MYRSVAAVMSGALVSVATVATAAPDHRNSQQPIPAIAQPQPPRAEIAAGAARLLEAARARPFAGFFGRFRARVLATLSGLLDAARALEKAPPTAMRAALARVHERYQASKRVFAWMRPTPQQMMEMVFLGRALVDLESSPEAEPGLRAGEEAPVVAHFSAPEAAASPGYPWHDGDD